MSHFAKRHEQAAATAGAALAIEPDFPIGRFRLAVAYKHLRQFDRATVEGRRAVEISRDNPDFLAQLGQISAMDGHPASARQVLERLKQLAGTRYVPAFDLALLHAALGERDEAFRSLERAYDERYGPLVFVAVEPDLDALRTDPRMKELIEKVRRGADQAAGASPAVR
jgi:Flp pilus assembly protein TadD